MDRGREGVMEEKGNCHGTKSGSEGRVHVTERECESDAVQNHLLSSF